MVNTVTTDTNFNWDDDAIMSTYDGLLALNPDSVAGASPAVQEAYAFAQAVREETIRMEQYQHDPAAWERQGNLPTDWSVVQDAEIKLYDYLENLDSATAESLSAEVSSISTSDADVGITAPTPDVVANAQYLAAEGLNEDGTERIAEPVRATPVVASTDFAAVNGSFDQEDFARALGIPNWRFSEANGLSMIQLRDMSPEEQITAIRQHIGDNVTPADLMDAIAEADPSLQELTDLVKADEELATAFHSAIVQDPTMLPGLQQMVSANGAEGFSTDDLTEILKMEGLQGRMARQGIIHGLNQVAETPLEFDHLLSLADSVKSMPEINSFADVLEAMRNPDQFIAVMLNGIDIPIEFKEMLAGFLSGLMPMLAEMIDPDGFLLRDFVDLGQDLGITAQMAGRPILDTVIETTGTVAYSGGDPDLARDFEDVDVADLPPAHTLPGNTGPALPNQTFG